MTPLIHWFRRDLRLRDNTALAAAARDSGGAVIPVFIFDETVLRGRFVGAARVRFLLESLEALTAALRERGSTLVLCRGNPQQELLRLLDEHHASGVYWNRDYSPYAVARDTAIKQALHNAGYRARSFKDLVVCEMDEITTNDGHPYKVYTPYARRWHQHLIATGVQVADVPDLRPVVGAETLSIALPTLVDLGLTTTQQALPGGEQPAHELLRTFTDLQQPLSIVSYKEARNLLALPGTSRLSAHLRLGTISVRTCVQAAQNALHSATPPAVVGIEAWLGELAWRDFYVQILYHFPHVLRGAFKPQYDALAWENDADLFAAWCAGRTGYPVVDAAMRQLNHEAWMHNRARMIVASFLTKDLLIDWRWGERYFMQHLVDGDPAANNGGWQWAAGTGTDAQPFFRIFNPTSQGQKFDPQGDYVRRYVPELAAVPDKYMHTPWIMSEADQRRYGVRIGHDYPVPVVDHKVQRKRALELYGRV